MEFTGVFPFLTAWYKVLKTDFDANTAIMMLETIKFSYTNIIEARQVLGSILDVDMLPLPLKLQGCKAINLGVG